MVGSGAIIGARGNAAQSESAGVEAFWCLSSDRLVSGDAARSGKLEFGYPQFVTLCGGVMS